MRKGGGVKALASSICCTVLVVLASCHASSAAPAARHCRTNPHLCRAYLSNRKAAVDFLNSADRVFVVDGYACWDPAVSSRRLLCCIVFWHRCSIILV